MSSIVVDHQQCITCKKCIDACPFNALELKDNKIVVNENCRVCSVCIKVCPTQALSLQKEEKALIDKSLYQGALVVVEHFNGKINPVTFELIGEAQRLMETINQTVSCILIGDDNEAMIQELSHYDLEFIYSYQHPELKDFRIDAYADMVEAVIHELCPSTILIGATPVGRSLAPRISTRFKTGLTADCTQLKMKKNTDLVQIRPAFGGNVLAQIITTNHRPQLATVRYQVMEKAQPSANSKVTVIRKSPQDIKSDIEIIDTIEKENSVDIGMADFLVVAGAGVKDAQGLELVKDLAKALNAHYAVTRPLVEIGLAEHSYQVGLSGRTVRPKYMITVGVSGAIQFTAGMENTETVVAIDQNEEASIFDIADVKVVGDLFKIIPHLIKEIEGVRNV